MNKEEFIKIFTEHALDNAISLFLGAGSSSDAGYPTWSKLFEPMAKKLGVTIDETTDYYKLAQYFSNQYGEAELKKKINCTLNSYEYKSPLITQLLDIGFENIWTTNFDNVIEENYKQRGISVNKVFTDEDLSTIDISKKINIFKMNGDINNPNRIIATTNDYEKYNYLHQLMLMFYKRELISNKFLFIGYSFTDNLVLNCISEINRYLGDCIVHHYTIMKNDVKNPYFKYFIEDLEKRYHISVLLVDNYSDIPKVLKELNLSIRNKKIFISGSLNSNDTQIENYSHNLSKMLSEKLLKNNYRIVNGIGRRFGTHLIGYANEYLAKSGVKNIEKYLIVRPFVSNKKNSNEDKNKVREEIISNCGVAIFVFGEIYKDKISGVMSEFEIARKLHKTIIPISYNGFISEKIYEIIRDNITEFPYLEGKLDKLTSENSLDNLTSTIINIIDSIQ